MVAEHMKIISAPVGKIIVDSLPFSQAGTLTQAKGFKVEGVVGVALYLGVASNTRLKAVLDAGLGAWGVTLAGQYGGAASVSQAQAIGFPKGSTLFLDVEGLTAFHTNPPDLIAKIQTWASAVVAAGYKAGIYVGSPQPLTSDELWKLAGITAYWRGQGSMRDRSNNLAEPTKCGWCVTQAFPSQTIAGTLVDANMVGQDYLGRVPTLVVG